MSCVECKHSRIVDDKLTATSYRACLRYPPQLRDLNKRPGEMSLGSIYPPIPEDPCGEFENKKGIPADE